MAGRAAVACDMAETGGSSGRRQRRAAAAGNGGGVWLLSPQLPGGANDESISILEEGETNTEQRHSECSEFLCPDINFMSAILGQNTKLCILAYHKIYVFVSLCS